MTTGSVGVSLCSSNRQDGRTITPHGVHRLQCNGRQPLSNPGTQCCATRPCAAARHGQQPRRVQPAAEWPDMAKCSNFRACIRQGEPPVESASRVRCWQTAVRTGDEVGGVEVENYTASSIEQAQTARCRGEHASAKANRSWRESQVYGTGRRPCVLATN
jgi:hypothetical protein